MTSKQVQDAILEAWENWKNIDALMTEERYNYGYGLPSGEYYHLHNIAKREERAIKTHLLHLKSLHPEMVIE